jgi:glutathione S-transferase
VHLDYMTYLLEQHSWLAGKRLSMADLTAASHLSCLDYLGDVPWDDYPAVRDWYAVMKSRPGFRGLLADHLPGFPAPPPHYADLDF